MLYIFYSKNCQIVEFNFVNCAKKINEKYCEKTCFCTCQQQKCKSGRASIYIYSLIGAFFHALDSMRKPVFCIYENKVAEVIAKLISAFVSATRIVKSLYFLNSKFQASSHLLSLYSPVCVGPGRKPRRLVFS